MSWALIFAPALLAVELPDIGNPADAAISPQEEQRIGENFMRNLRRSVALVSDPEVHEYINSLGYRLVSNSEQQDGAFTFFVVEDPAINAFAVPGGFIGINSGLILASTSEGELASVLAHEIAHVTQRHIARAVNRSSNMNLPATAALIAAIILGARSGQAGEVGQAAVMATVAGTTQASINFTRANEQEADRLGIQTLARSGFDPRYMPLFFERLQQASRYYKSDMPEFLRTHPITINRIADSRGRAEQYPRPEKSDLISDYLLIHAKLQTRYDQEALSRFKIALQGRAGPQQDAARYGYVLTLRHAGNYDEARKQLAILLKKDPQRIAYRIAAAKTEQIAGNSAEALRIYRDAFNISPHNMPITVHYGEALLEAGEAEQARQILAELTQRHDHEPSIYQLLARSETESGHPVDAHQSLAEYYYLSGETRAAIDQLEIALQLAGDGARYQTARIEDKLVQLRHESETEEEH
ncbi:MAG: M48 family metallopeptidase [Gammaproteobacteria bacterium]|nr:M48 family metallopeptidase [Gammaproteobacteria bacterium]